MTKVDKEDQQECFNLFADTFGKCMIKRELWKNKLSRVANVLFSDVVTISDEAFAIFTIERNWNIWKNEHDGALVKLRSGEYTTLNTNVKYGGWTKEGMQRFDTMCENIMTVRRQFKVRTEIEKIYKLERFPYTITDSNIPGQIPIKTNIEDVDEHCCWNEFMLESEDEEPSKPSDSQPYNLELPDNQDILNANCIVPQELTQDQYAQKDPPSDVLSDNKNENSDYDDDNVDSQSFGHHQFSDDGEQMNHKARYCYQSEASVNY